MTGALNPSSFVRHLLSMSQRLLHAPLRASATCSFAFAKLVAQ